MLSAVTCACAFLIVLIDMAYVTDCCTELQNNCEKSDLCTTLVDNCCYSTEVVSNSSTVQCLLALVVL
jgi:hypothetical protein